MLLFFSYSWLEKNYNLGGIEWKRERMGKIEEGGVYQFQRAAITKYHKQSSCGLKQQEFILSQFQRLEVWNWGADRVVFCLKALVGRILPCLLVALGGCLQSLACRHITPVFASIVMWRFPCVSLSKFPSFYRDTSHIGYRFRAHPNPLWPHLNLIHLQSPCFQIGSHSQVLDGCKFGGTLFKPEQRVLSSIYILRFKPTH